MDCSIASQRPCPETVEHVIAGFLTTRRSMKRSVQVHGLRRAQFVFSAVEVGADAEAGDIKRLGRRAGRAWSPIRQCLAARPSLSVTGGSVHPRRVSSHSPSTASEAMMKWREAIRQEHAGLQLWSHGACGPRPVQGSGAVRRRTRGSCRDQTEALAVVVHRPCVFFCRSRGP